MITDAYPPMRTSCAVQMYDLAQAFIEEGHQVTVITPDSTPKQNIRITQQDGVRLVQVKAFETKDINYVSRTLAEFINPFLIWQKLKKSSEFINTQYDGIIWYSPTIFWGPLIKRLKRQFKVKAYLILRDIFPDWALDLGLLKNGLGYQFLKTVENFQYQQADIIGVQSPNNLKYFNKKNPKVQATVQVLWNWIGEIKEIPCPIDLSKTIFARRKNFIYAGNMGIAQDMDRIIDLARALKNNLEIGFVLIGRGSELERIQVACQVENLDNIIFFNEINPAELPGLFKQCAVGMIALDSRHSSHNIPGKFLSYLLSGLPVLAIGNPGNDLEDIIKSNNIGIYQSFTSIDNIKILPLKILEMQSSDIDLHDRCIRVAKELFSSQIASKQIETAFAEV